MAFIDFEINIRGDLLVKEQLGCSNFAINFTMSKYPQFKVKFFQAKPGIRANKPHFQINFCINNKEKPTTYKAQTVVDELEIAQDIYIRLRTQLGELTQRPQIGSLLYLIRHENLYSKAVMDKIQTYVMEAIDGLVPNASVLAKPEKLEHSFFYCQNVAIYIYSNGILFYKFTI